MNDPEFIKHPVIIECRRYLAEENPQKMIEYCLKEIDNQCVEAMFYLGLYYQVADKNDDLMKKYYLMAIEHGYNSAINNLGIYYCDINEELAITFFLMGVVNKDYRSMYNLGTIYCEKKDYETMLKYYLMSLEQQYSAPALDSLINHYHSRENNMEKVIYYCLIGAKHENVKCMYILGIYYNNRNEEEMKKYLVMASEHGHEKSMIELINYYKYPELKTYLWHGMKYHPAICFKELNNIYRFNNIKLLKLHIKCIDYNVTNRKKIIKLFNAVCNEKAVDMDKYLQLITSFQFLPEDDLCVGLRLLTNTLNQKIELIDLHFKYSLEGLGFKEAKQDFLEQCL